MNTLSKITINGTQYSFDTLSGMEILQPTFVHGTDTFEYTCHFVKLSKLVLCYVDVMVLKIPSDAIRDDELGRYRIPFIEFSTDMDASKPCTIQLDPFKCDKPREHAFLVPSPTYPNRLNIHAPILYNQCFFHGQGFIYLK